MITPIDRVLAALRDHDRNPSRSGDGWRCRCPAHNDRKPSLSIRVGDDGRVLMHCHAMCAIDAICSAIGLTTSDLFVQAPDHGNGRASHRRRSNGVAGTRRASARTGDASKQDHTFATASEAIAAMERRYGRKSAHWMYSNAKGEPVGVVIRWDTAVGKDIRPVSRIAGRERWSMAGMPVPRPLYRLPELLATKPGDRVYIAEGEKVVEAIRSLGLVGTTSPHGSASASKADWSGVAARHVVVLVDHDDAGEVYGAEVARLCIGAGALSVRIVRLAELWPEMPERGDLVDLLAHRSGDIEGVRSEVEALVNRTDPEPMASLAGECGDDDFVAFPVHVLPNPVRLFVEDVAKSIGCDTSFVALPLLSGMAAAIGNTFRLRLSSTWDVPAIVWTVIVGESGTHKSPAFKAAMRVFRTVQDRAFKEQGAAMAEWEAQRLQYEAELTVWKRDAAKGRANDGYAVAPPRQPVPPVAKRYLVSDTTIEAIAPILLANPRGLLLGRDELAGWFGSFDRYAKGGRGADSAHWLSMHDAEALTIDRKTGIPPTIYVPSAAVSISGGIQPGIGTGDEPGASRERNAGTFAFRDAPASPEAMD